MKNVSINTKSQSGKKKNLNIARFSIEFYATKNLLQKFGHISRIIHNVGQPSIEKKNLIPQQL